MRRALLLADVAVAVGCLAAPAPVSPAGTGGTDALPFPDPMADHRDHADATLHANSYQFALTDHQALAGSATHSSGAHALDKRGGWLFVASYGGEADAEGGFFVYNVSDAEHPKLVSRYRFAGAMGGDRSLEATDDANFVVIGTEPVDCVGHVNPFGPGLYLFDVHDKTNPLPVDYLPSTGVHSVTVHRINGADYVFGLMPDKNVIKIDTSGPAKAKLVPVGTVSIGHDSVVVDDPLLGGKPVLYASNGGGGFEISDVSKPESPQKLAAWNIPDRPKGKYYIHTGAVQFIHGRRIAVVTTEDWEDYPSVAYVVDATDFGYVETLVNWSAPGHHAAAGLEFSMHNPRFYGNDLVLAYYHGGVWSLDLNDPAHPKIVGQYMPKVSNGYKPNAGDRSVAAYPDICGSLKLYDVPDVFDVEPGDGVVYVADLHTGLYTLKPLW